MTWAKVIVVFTKPTSIDRCTVMAGIVVSRGEWGPSQPPRIPPTLKESEAKSKAIVEDGPAS